MKHILARAQTALLALFVLVLPGVAFAQTWYRLGGDLKEAAWLDENTIVAVGQGGTIIRSADRGETWNLQHTGVGTDLRDLCFVDRDTGLIVGVYGTLLRTTDGGRMWNRIADTSDRHFIRLTFSAGGKFGYVATLDGEVLKSTDRGMSWSLAGRVPPTTNGIPTVAAIRALSDSVIIAGGGGRVWRSVDAGASWMQAYSTSDSLAVIWDFDVSTRTGRVIGAGSRVGGNTSMVVMTEDSGRTWREMAVDALVFQPRAVAFNGGDTILVTGQNFSSSSPSLTRGAFSSDLGRTWHPVEINDQSGYMGVDAIAMSPADPSRGVAVGTHGGIYFTTDGGASWRTRSYARIYDPVIIPQYFSHFIYGAHLFDTDTAVAYARDGWGTGSVLRTTDAGATWKSIRAGAPVTGAVYLSDEIGIGIPVFGSTSAIDRKVFTTMDRGAVWELSRRTFDRPYSYRNTSAPTRTTSGSVVFPADSMLFESLDSGQTWHLMAAVKGSLGLSQVSFQGRYGWCVAALPPSDTTGTRQNVAILRAESSNPTIWEPIRVMSGLLSDILPRGLHFFDEETGYFALGRTIYRTRDAGSTWDSLAGLPDRIGDIRFLSQLKGLVVGARAMIMYTTDGGESWERLRPWESNQMDEHRGFSNIAVSPDGRTVLLTGEALLVKGVFSDPLSTVRQEGRMEGASTLLRVWPNPVTGSVVSVDFQGRVASDARLELLDVSGRVVWSRPAAARLSSKEDHLIDLSDVPNGVYRVSLRYGQRRISSWIIVLR